MTAAVARDSNSTQRSGGLRPIKPRHDMSAVARLIEVSFAGELDESSRRMVREMRAFGQAGWLGWLIGRLFLPPAAYPQGFVWEEEGKLVGNASLLPVSSQSDRWVLANVAVHPDYRRRGIARKLVMACLDLAKQRDARELVLQVRYDNEGAKELYRKLGFMELTTRTRWKRRPSQSFGAGDEPNLREARSEEWDRLWLLAKELFPEGIQWPYQLRHDWFEPSPLPVFLAPQQSRAWVLAGREDQVRAGLVARFSQDNRGWQLGLLVPPEYRGELEIPLIRRAVYQLGPLGFPAVLSYPPGIVDDELELLAFRARRTLTWMGLTI
ncbi:MAG: GNAT family N-acetyltransferase [Anaerolineales bacterium]